jgi:hypothetical protein
VRIHWTEWVLLTAIAGSAYAAFYGAVVRLMRQAVAEKQRETDRQLSAMAATVSALRARVAELGGVQTQQTRSAAGGAMKAGDSAGERMGTSEAETVAVLTAAATMFLGTKARIRSAQIAPVERGSAGTWAQQGRANVQTSHNPRSRG